ncbi:MAG: phenylphosphate carboxylase subunit delta, partial [Burkholderiaceae bacterium]|nr:phenylphosphate carboxylase subunit delta [Burkholderiaceae bacterium]
MATPVTSTAVARAARVRLMILDVDGVLTDGRLCYGGHGEVLKSFNVRDGHGIKLLREAGVEVAILTARKSEI